MKKLFKSTVLGVCLLASGFANAALVTQWAYEVSSQWTAATFVDGAGGDGGSQTFTSNILSWGSSAAGADYNDDDLNRSALVISNSPKSGTDLFTNGLFPALTNVITHFNNTISNTFKTLAGAKLQTSLKLKPYMPIEAPDFLEAKVLNFTINFTETPNDGDCDFDSDSNCDDIFVITIGDLSDSFTYDGILYGVNIVETTASLLGLSPEACVQAGAAPNCIGFKTQEGLATDAQFGIFINAIPEPVGVAGLALGILSLMIVGRRRKIQA